MIPVTTNLIELVKIDSHDKKYQDLLNAELADIRSRTDKILKDAKRVYNLTTKYRNEKANKKLVERCYDFKMLEIKLLKYTR